MAATVSAAALVPALAHAEPHSGHHSATSPGPNAGRNPANANGSANANANGNGANGRGNRSNRNNANTGANTTNASATSTSTNGSTASTSNGPAASTAPAGASTTPTGGFTPQALDAVKQQVAALYQQAEASTEQYDATEERIARLQAAVASSSTRSAELRVQLAAATGSLGRLAAEQYRDAGMSPSMALVFSAHPDSYLERAGLTDRVATVDQQRLIAVLRDQQALSSLNRESAAELADLHAAELQLAAHRADIDARLAEARARLDALGAAERADVTTALAHGDDGDGLGSTVPAAAPSLSSLLSAVTDAASALSAPSGGADALATAASAPPDATRIVKAVETAYNELGKPYVWGATGPGEFDCSGLTQHVWASAGVQLPRTSQEQANVGQTVPLSSVRPGDLVVYFPGATHIGIYVGHGLVIHAPRPGSVVQFTPLDSMPINKVVRPVS